MILPADRYACDAGSLANAYDEARYHNEKSPVFRRSYIGIGTSF